VRIFRHGLTRIYTVREKYIMWLPKDEKETLIFYYRQWAAGNIPFPPKKPWDDGVHLRLGNRDLITVEYVNNIPLVTLTPEGIRLGQIYNSWWSRSNLWYAEHIKDHWFWLILSFLGGIIGAVLVNWLSKIFG